MTKKFLIVNNTHTCTDLPILLKFGTKLDHATAKVWYGTSSRSRVNVLGNSEVTMGKIC